MRKLLNVVSWLLSDSKIKRATFDFVILGLQRIADVLELC